MTELKIDKLQKIAKAMKAKPPMAKIGIMGGRNAEIGAIHEFGTVTTPQRSFLRIPLTEHLSRYMTDAKFSETDLKKVIQQINLQPWTEIIAETAKKLIDDAFDTGGFGKWAPDQRRAYSDLSRSGKLRDSITYEVKE